MRTSQDMPCAHMHSTSAFDQCTDVWSIIKINGLSQRQSYADWHHGIPAPLVCLAACRCHIGRVASWPSFPPDWQL